MPPVGGRVARRRTAGLQQHRGEHPGSEGAHRHNNRLHQGPEPAQIDGTDDKEITIKFSTGERKFTGNPCC